MLCVCLCECARETWLSQKFEKLLTCVISVIHVPFRHYVKLNQNAGDRVRACMCVGRKDRVQDATWKSFRSSGSDIVCFKLVQIPYVHVKRSQCCTSTVHFTLSEWPDVMMYLKIAWLCFCFCIVIRSSWTVCPVSWVIVLFLLNCK